MTTDATAAHVALRERLMVAAMAHVIFDGWTWRAIEAGANDLGLDAVEARRLHPGGPAGMFRLFSGWADTQMAEAIDWQDLEEMRLNQRVQAAVLTRLKVLVPYREAVRRGATFAALPQNVPLGLACFGQTVDRVWHLVGDRSADFNYYTKRALLAGVLATTTLVWLDDRTEDDRITKEFLARRIADVLRIQRVRGRLERMVARMPNPRAFRPRRGANFV